MYINKKRGSVLVDAAICMPVFILAMVSLISLVIQSGKELSAYSRLVDSAETALIMNTEGEMTIPAIAGDAVIQVCFRPWIGESEDFAAGSLVYVFPKYGECYHVQGCFTMDQYPDNYVPMEKDEAADKGYVPCRICIGNDE